MAERKIEMRDGEIITPLQQVTMSGGDIEAGHMVGALSLGLVTPAGDIVGQKVVGIANETKSGSVVGSHFHTIEILRNKAFKLKNSTSAPIDFIFSNAYVEDSETVCTIDGATNNVLVGTVLQIDDDGVWVEIK